MTTTEIIYLALAVGSYLLHGYMAYRGSQPAAPTLPNLAASPLSTISLPQISSPASGPAAPADHITIGNGQLLKLLMSAIMTQPPTLNTGQSIPQLTPATPAQPQVTAAAS